MSTDDAISPLQRTSVSCLIFHPGADYEAASFLALSLATLVFCSCGPEGSNQTYQGRSADAWVQLLNDADAGTRDNAVSAVAHLAAQDHSFIADLKPLLQDPNEQVRVHADVDYYILSKDSSAAAPVLATALDDDKADESIRVISAEQLGKMNQLPSVALDSLEKNCRPDLVGIPEVQEAAQAALHQQSPNRYARAEAEWKSVSGGRGFTN